MSPNFIIGQRVILRAYGVTLTLHFKLVEIIIFPCASLDRSLHIFDLV